MTRRKRLELMNGRTNRQGTLGTDESSLSSVNDYRSVCWKSMFFNS